MGEACSDVQQRGDRSSPDSRDARLPRGRSKSGRRLRAPERRSLGCMSDVAKTIEAVWKIESTRLIAAIARVTHDIGIAEELAQDALVTALEVWPEEGIPENPGAWLMTAAKRRAIDSPKATSTTSSLLAHRISVISAPWTCLTSPAADSALSATGIATIEERSHVICTILAF